MDGIFQTLQIALLFPSFNVSISQIETHFDNKSLSSRLRVCGGEFPAVPLFQAFDIGPAERFLGGILCSPRQQEAKA